MFLSSFSTRAVHGHYDEHGRAPVIGLGLVFNPSHWACACEVDSHPIKLIMRD